MTRTDPSAPASPEAARILIWACLLCAAVVGTMAVFPFSPTAPRALAAVLCVVGVVLAAGLHLAGSRLRSWHLHAVLALAVALVTLCVASSTTPDGMLVTAISYLWITLYSAAFHRPRVVWRYVVGIAAGLALGLWHAAPPATAHTWFFLTATFTAVAVLLNGRIVALRDEAMTDALTGVLSRRAFMRAAEVEMSRAARTGRPLTMALLDLDDFKLVNDARGHSAGDAVLVGLTSSWRSSLRRQDVVGRIGGDEFVVLLPDTDAIGAGVVLGKLSSDLCSWSAGVATWSGGDFDTWFSAADQDLYATKGS